MTGKRKRYSADFKAKVTLEAIRGEQMVAQCLWSSLDTKRSSTSDHQSATSDRRKEGAVRAPLTMISHRRLKGRDRRWRGTRATDPAAISYLVVRRAAADPASCWQLALTTDRSMHPG